MSALPSYGPTRSVPDTLAEALDAFAVHALTFRRLRARTVETYVWHLRRVLASMPLGAHHGRITAEMLRD